MRQAALECALDLDNQAVQEYAQELDKQSTENLPDYETQVLEEGEIPLGPGEYPGSVPVSPPLQPKNDIPNCPIHPRAPLKLKTSKRGWNYVQCDELGCPFWCARDRVMDLWFAWFLQACQDVKEGPFTCLCDKPYQLVLCRGDSGNCGRLILSCRQSSKCRFFQWADRPRDRKGIKAYHEVRGDTYSRENRLRRERRQRLAVEAYNNPHHHPEYNHRPYYESEFQSRGKRPQPRVQQQETHHYDRARREIDFNPGRDGCWTSTQEEKKRTRDASTQTYDEPPPPPKRVKQPESPQDREYDGFWSIRNY